MTKTKVLLIFGGQSSEHEISIMSAKNIEAIIDRSRFEVKLAYINRTGQWFLADKVTTSENSPLQIDLKTKAFLTVDGAYRPDVLLPVLHGRNGEDGMIAAVGQLLNIRVVGSDMTASSVAMDKLLTKKIVERDGVPVAQFCSLYKDDNRPSYEVLEKQFGPVFFVKPTREGSSVGISKVKNQIELEQALDLAFDHDDTVLIEKAMIGRELEVAVLGRGNDIIISPVGEILVGETDEFYSYEAKYADNSKASTAVSANLDHKTEAKIQTIARTVYQSLRCSGLARVDFFLVDREAYFNEINTLPGFTDISMYPKMMENSGLSQRDLITKLIEIA